MRGSSGREQAGVGGMGAVEIANPWRRLDDLCLRASVAALLEPADLSRRFVPGVRPAESEREGLRRPLDPVVARSGTTAPAAARPTARPVRAPAGDVDRAAELAPAAIADRAALRGIAGAESCMIIQVWAELLRLPRTQNIKSIPVQVNTERPKNSTCAKSRAFLKKKETIRVWSILST